MTMPTANGVIAQQTADSHDTEKNIFSGESHSDDNGRAGEAANAALATTNVAPATTNVAPATTIRATPSSRARTTSRGATSATFTAG